MKTNLLTALTVCLTSTAAFAVVPVGPPPATLTGSSVTGDLNFSGGSVNYFDPGNGFVPAGSDNSSGPTVTIGSSTTFSFADGANEDTATFTGTQLTVSDLDSGGAGPWTMTFTDSAFTTLSTVSDDFINGGLDASLSGDVLTISWAGDPRNFETVVTANDTQQGPPQYTGVFNLEASVPDGGTTAGLLGLAMAGLGCLKRSKFFAR